MSDAAQADEELVRTTSAEIRERQRERRAVDDDPAAEGDAGGAEDDSVQPDSEPTAPFDDAGPSDDDAPEPAELRSIDDVAARHPPSDPPSDGPPKKTERRGRKKKSQRKGKKENGAAPRGTPIEETGIIADSNIAEFEVQTSEDAVPGIDGTGADRHVISVGPIEPAEDLQFPDLAGSELKQPTNLTDICRIFQIGQGDRACHIRVERKEPKTYQGSQIAGYLGKIRRPIDEAEFRDMAGGGTYELVVHGPDPMGRVNPYSGAIEIKPLTKPVRIQMPGQPHFVDFDEDDSPPGRAPMHQGWDPTERRGRVVPTTSAEASVFKEMSGLVRDHLKDTKEERDKLREQAFSQKGPSVDTGVVEFLRDSARTGIDAVKETGKTTVELLRQQLEDVRKENEAYRNKLDEERRERATSSSNDLNGMASLVQALSPSRDTSGDLQRIYDQHIREMDRAKEHHERAIEALRSAYDDRIRSKDEELRRTQEYYEKRSEEQRREADRREQLLKDDFERRERALKESYDATVARMKEDHLRELDNLKGREEVVRETNKVAWETRIATAEERARVAEQEAQRAREQAEKKADIAGQLEEYSQVAELLGFRKQDGEDTPKDWKERLAQSVGQAMENLPTLFERAGEAFQHRADATRAQTEAMRTAASVQAGRQPPGPQVRRPPGRVIRGQGGAPVNVPARPAGWATDDGIAPRTVGAGTPAEVRPEQKPPPTDEDAVRAQAHTDHERMHGQHPPAFPTPAPSQPVSEQVPAPRSGPGLSPEMAEQVRKGLEQAFTAQEEPADIAQQLLQAWGPTMLSGIVSTISIEQLIEAVSEDPAAASSPLLTRDGLAWFRRVWAESQSLVQK